MSSKCVGPMGGPDWSSPAESVDMDNNVPSSSASSESTEAQSPANDTSVAPSAGFSVPKQAEASLDGSAMKATINAIPINQPTPQPHDYAAEARANWQASTSPAQKAAALENPLPPLKTFVGEHERTVNEGAFDNLPFVGDIAKLGRHIGEFISGSDASGNAIDRGDKSREISREVLSEAAGMATGDAAGEFYGEAISAVAGKGAGAIATMAVDQVTDKAVSKASEAALKHIAGNDAAE